jgi:hypothetical protein
MRYLKTYKIFESNEDTRYATSDEVSNIEDILLNIKDLDFHVEIHKNIGGENYSCGPVEVECEVCRIYIEKFDVYGFSQEERECKYSPSEEFILTLKHLVSYVKEIDFDIEIESIDDSSVIDRVSSEDGELNDEDVSVFSRYELNGTPISYIKIIITYKDTL